MASTVHGELEANEVTTVTISTKALRVEVLNREGTSEIFFRIDGSDPEIDGEDCFIVPAAVSSVSVQTTPLNREAGAVEVRMISEDSQKFSVAGEV